MGFPQNVRTAALVASARHCAVCHRYKGVRVEVHHIIPASEGGADTLENAIPLRFDCHADAGHYNPSHPKGTRFSTQELRSHRDAWYEHVRGHSVPVSNGKDFMLNRFFVAKDFGAIAEVATNRLDRIPFGCRMLVQNDILQFQKQIVNSHGTSYRHSVIGGESFTDREEYLKAHPNAEKIANPCPYYPYFEFRRGLDGQDIQDSVAPHDIVSRWLLDAGVAPAEIASGLAYMEVCGPDHYQEVFRTRPFWAVFLALTNITDSPLTLQGLEVLGEGPGFPIYRQFRGPRGPIEATLSLPAAPVDPNHTVLIPVASLVGPFEPVSEPIWSQTKSDFPTGQYQLTTHTSLDHLSAITHLFGPAIWPQGVTLMQGGQQLFQGIHSFDLGNLYALERGWECGSCPHIFFQAQSSTQIAYAGECFAAHPGIPGTQTIRVPPDSDQLIIAELEQECTFLDAVLINGTIVEKNRILTRGERLAVKVAPGDFVELHGHYETSEAAADRRDPWHRNTVVSEFLQGTIQPLH